uniref:Secreted protein n=1 Tax=Rodentolepis nana TaxID=102285 RepID=A0A0R3TGA7_RODNA
LQVFLFLQTQLFVFRCFRSGFLLILLLSKPFSFSLLLLLCRRIRVKLRFFSTSRSITTTCRQLSKHSKVQCITYTFSSTRHASHTLTSFSMPYLGRPALPVVQSPQKTFPQLRQWC